MAKTTGAPGDRPIVMTDVVRELQALADVAARHRAEELALAGRRMQSLLERLRNQFLLDVVESTPSANGTIPLDRYRTGSRAAEDPLAANGTTA